MIANVPRGRTPVACTVALQPLVISLPEPGLRRAPLRGSSRGPSPPKRSRAVVSRPSAAFKAPRASRAGGPLDDLEDRAVAAGRRRVVRHACGVVLCGCARGAAATRRRVLRVSAKEALCVSATGRGRRRRICGGVVFYGCARGAAATRGRLPRPHPSTPRLVSASGRRCRRSCSRSTSRRGLAAMRPRVDASPRAPAASPRAVARTYGARAHGGEQHARASSSAHRNIPPARDLK